ncbi:MAG: SpoIID/LytB domain-containing protein [Bryobacteraceae bacterium]
MKLLAALLALTTIASAETLRVQANGRVVEMELEQYVAGVLGGESSVFQSIEALKAMAIAARTYAVHFHGRHADEGFDVCDKTHCQRLDTKAITARLIEAAKATAGQLVLYRNQPAATYFHRDCGGKTENVRAVWPEETAPYLLSHADPYCQRRPWHWDVSVTDLASTLRQSGLKAPTPLQRVSITQRTASGRAQQLALLGAGGSVRIDASSLRFAVGRLLGFNSIPSDSYNVGVSGDRVVFDGVGSGHGVGLCQNGAEQMGAQGHNYREILAFYYPGTSVAAKAHLLWQRISGERLALFTTQPDRDSGLLTNAERLLRSAESRLKLPAPDPLEIRIYPDIAAFRDATGEPGWVAARTRGRLIDLQPVALLRSRGALDSTLQHEFFHAILENHARAGLPVWFREGLAAFFSGPGSATDSAAVFDEDLRQITEQARARAAYQAARNRVAALVGRYGETTVLGWLRLDLPREVTNASNKQATTKSK